MFTADQIVAHLIGDYLIQSDWMANTKTKGWVPAIAHAASYGVPFVPLAVCLDWSTGYFSVQWVALLVIIATHFMIDHWRLARYVVYAKNFLAPRKTVTLHKEPYFTAGGKELFNEKYEVQVWWHKWADCVGTGYHKDRPPWMAVWLLIIADNTLHFICNALALRFL